MADRPEPSPPPELTIVDPRDPFAPLHPGELDLPRPLRFAIKALFATAAVLLVVIFVSFHYLSGSATSRDKKLNAESSLLRIQVQSASPVPQQTTRAQLLGYARVDVTLRNVSPLPVRILRQRIDDGPPADHSPADRIGAGGTVVVEVVWRLRCAEIGNVAGPPLLALTVRGPIGDHEMRVALPRSTNRAFHLAATAACGDA
jgi:hypothetical protein